jgi:hypothetical protein
MDAETRRQLPSVRAFINLDGAKQVVDVGGSYGALISGLVQRNSGRLGILFDLSEVIDMGCPPRRGDIDCCRGDFFHDDVPSGDVLLLKGVLHDWDDTRALIILKKCCQAMRRTGHLYIIERLLSGERAASLPALFDLHMLVMSGGQERTKSEFSCLLAAAGLHLENCRLDCATGLSILKARRITRKRTPHTTKT